MALKTSKMLFYSCAGLHKNSYAFFFGAVDKCAASSMMWRNFMISVIFSYQFFFRFVLNRRNYWKDYNADVKGKAVLCVGKRLVFVIFHFTTWLIHMQFSAIPNPKFKRKITTLRTSKQIATRFKAATSIEVANAQNNICRGKKNKWNFMKPSEWERTRKIIKRN